MIRAASLLVVLGACTTSEPSTPLSELRPMYGDTTLEVVARGQINIQLYVAPTAGCPVLGDDVVATFNGERMRVSRGGYDVTANGCYPIAFWFDVLPSAVTGVERRLSGSQLIVEDSSASWQIDTTRLFGANFELDAAASRIVWHDVATISAARISPTVAIDITDNVIAFPPGTDVTWVDARANPAAMRCDGPALCTVFLESARDFTLAP
jgi:hypothetical protein